MTLQEIEKQLHEVIEQCEGRGVPPSDTADMKELCAAGEPGIALENLCTQLYEYDVPVPTAVLEKVRELGTAMRIKASYWEPLRVNDGGG